MEIEDRWTAVDAGSGERVRTDRWGSGLRWRARWRDDDGRRRSRSFATRDEAVVELAAIRADMARGRYVDPGAGDIRFGEYAERWFAAREYAPLTRLGTRGRLDNHILPFFGRLRLREIRPSTVQAWNVGLRDAGLAGSTRQLLFGFVFSVLAQAVDDGLIATNPAAARSVRPPRRERQLVDPWSVERVAAFRAQLPERWAVLADLGALAGLRQGEALGIDAVSDIDWAAGVLHVNRQVLQFPSSRLAYALPKYGKTRSVPVPDRLLEALDAHLVRWPAREVVLPWGEPGGPPRAHRLLVTSREGRSPSRSYLNHHVWKPALLRAGIEPGRANGSHALRHHYASVLLAGGESILAVAARLGHSDPAFTLRTYTHLMPGSEQQTRAALDAAWGAGGGAAAASAGGDGGSGAGAKRPVRRGHLRVID